MKINAEGGGCSILLPGIIRICVCVCVCVFIALHVVKDWDKSKMACRRGRKRRGGLAALEEIITNPKTIKCPKVLDSIW